MAKCSHGHLDVLWWKGCDLMAVTYLKGSASWTKLRHLIVPRGAARGRGERLQRLLSLTEPLRLYHSIGLAADRLLHAR